MSKPKVFIVDDHAGMREALTSFLAKDFTVIGCAASAEEALLAESIADAAVVLIDVWLPRMSGMDLVEALIKRWPHIRCLMLSGHDSISYVKRSLAAGACGYLRKDDLDEIVDAVRRVAAGESYICRHFRQQFRAP